MLITSLAGAEPRTLASGVYTRDQASIGEDLYDAHCATCHEPDYFQGVFRSWSGVALDELFDVMAGTMPQSNPGSLLNAEYVQIFSYILEENDFPAGEGALSIYGLGFDEIMVVAP